MVLVSVLLNASAEICAGSQASRYQILGLASWGPWDDPGTLGSSRKATLRSRLGFYRFLADLADPFSQLVGYL